MCEQMITAGEFGIELAVKEALHEIEKSLLASASIEGWDSGTTAVVCVVDGENIVVANVGDSRAVLSLDGKAKLMTEDHDLYNKKEKQRVESEGCSTHGGYLSNELCVTRALGDVDLKAGRKLKGLSAEPYFEKCPVSMSSEFLVLACDGLWDVLGLQAVVNFVRISLERHGDADRAAKEIVQQAMNRSSTDNITAIVVCLPRHAKPATRRKTSARPVIKFSALSGEIQQLLFQAANSELR